MHAFDVLGDPVRRRILELLADGELSSGAITEVIRAEFGISQPAVSQHLRVLREHGFATARADGARRLYAVGADPFEEVDAWLERFSRRSGPAARRARDRARPRQAQTPAPGRRLGSPTTRRRICVSILARLSCSAVGDWSPDAPTAPARLRAAPRRGKPPRHLIDLDPAERRAAVVELGEPAFRADQLSRHVFGHFNADPASWTDVPERSRDPLATALLPALVTPVRHIEADAGATRKTLWRLHDGTLVESVLMRYRRGRRASADLGEEADEQHGSERVTICVSSQAGCGMACPFCATGQQGLTRNLSTAEIVGQVVACARRPRPRRRHRRPRSRLEHRVHGHGRAAGQLQSRGRRAAPSDRAGPGRHGAVPPGDHRVDGRPGAGDRQARRRGSGGHARGLAACAGRPAPQRPRAGQHPVERRRGDRRRLPLLRADRPPGLRSSTR